MDGNTQTDPDATQFHTDDILRFWRAFDHATPETAVQVFRNEYLLMASPGLEDFIRLRIGDADTFTSTVFAKRAYYQAIRSHTLRVMDMQQPILSALRAMKNLFGAALERGPWFPDVYFLIGRLSSGGTLSAAGLLIGTEFYAADPETPLHELNSWERSVVGDLEILPRIVAHELIHYQHLMQQRLLYGDEAQRAPTLLEAVFAEGLAEYFGALVSDGFINPRLHEYGRAREAALWRRFLADLQNPDLEGTDLSGWLYQGVGAGGEPADLGYFIGHELVSAYYERATSKGEALKTLLTTRDPWDILRETGFDLRG